MIVEILELISDFVTAIFNKDSSADEDEEGQSDVNDK